MTRSSTQQCNLQCANFSILTKYLITLKLKISMLITLLKVRLAFTVSWIKTSLIVYTDMDFVQNMKTKRSHIETDFMESTFYFNYVK